MLRNSNEELYRPGNITAVTRYHGIMNELGLVSKSSKCLAPQTVAGHECPIQGSLPVTDAFFDLLTRSSLNSSYEFSVATS
jgi:hypothetical protein